MRLGGNERAVVQTGDSAIVLFLDGCRIELRVVGKMLTAQGDDRVVMTESRKESRDGDVRFALVLGECVHCAQVNLDCFQLD